MTDREKSEFYRKLAKLRKPLKEAVKPIYVAVGGREVVGESVDRGNALATVQAITTAMKVLESMRTEAVYEAGKSGAGYPDIGAAAGISRQAAREQWPGAVRSTRTGAGPCPLSAYLRKIAPIPDIECDAGAPRAFYWLEYKVAPAGVQVPGCLTHAALYRKLMGQHAVHLGGDEARQARRLIASPELADPIRVLLHAQARHGNTVAMRELAWRIETDADGGAADTSWLQAAAKRGDRHAARAWARHLEQQWRIRELIELWRRLAADGDRFACAELSAIYTRHHRHDLAAAVWRPLAVKGDGFALQAYAETLHGAHRIDDAIPVFQRAYEHHRRQRGNVGHLSGDREWGTACHTLIDLLIEDGRDHQALTWLRRVVKAEPPPKWALDELTWRLERAGQLDEAEGWYRRTVDEGWYREPNPDIPKPSQKLYQFLLRTGRTSQAEELLRDPSVQGLAVARREVIRSFQAASLEADLSAYVNAIIADGRADEFGEHAHELERTGASGEAIVMWLAAAEHGDFHARWEAVRLMNENGRAEEAEAWLRDLIKAGLAPPMDKFDPDEDRPRWHAQNRARDGGELSARQATRVLAALLEKRGRVEEALTLLRRTADQGDRYAQQDLQRMIKRPHRVTQGQPT
jgi:tetratricopeptide (TPR) repeat protein